jgi:hypothetical protein
LPHGSDLLKNWKNWRTKKWRGSGLVALFLALVFVQIYASIDAKHQENQTIIDEARGFEITFTSAMLTDAKSVYIDCGIGTFVLPSHQDHVFVVLFGKVLTCHASWKLLKATIIAFDSKKDLLLNQEIRWLIKPNELAQIIDEFPHR